MNVLNAEIDPVVEKHKTPCLKQWTLHTVETTENQVYCASIYRIGRDPYFEYSGSWMLSDPIGNDVSKTHNDIYHIGEVNKEIISSIRKALPLRPSFKFEYNLDKI